MCVKTAINARLKKIMMILHTVLWKIDVMQCVWMMQ